MQAAPTPLGLYRITRSAHDSLFPPAGGPGRFDDPDREFRVLYTAVERQAAFAESLQFFRPDLAARAALAALRFDEVTHPPVNLRSWAGSRTLLQLRLPGTANLLDLRKSTVVELVADAVADDLATLGLSDFDESHILGNNREVTQLIARWAVESDYDGILSASRFAAEWTTCAVFNRIRPRVVGREPISLNDPDLSAIAAAFHLRISG